MMHLLIDVDTFYILKKHWTETLYQNRMISIAREFLFILCHNEFICIVVASI